MKETLLKERARPWEVHAGALLGAIGPRSIDRPRGKWERALMRPRSTRRMARVRSWRPRDSDLSLNCPVVGWLMIRARRCKEKRIGRSSCHITVQKDGHGFSLWAAENQCEWCSLGLSCPVGLYTDFSKVQNGRELCQGKENTDLMRGCSRQST